jgi:DNA polymerase
VNSDNLDRLALERVARSRELREVANDIRSCRRCVGLNILGKTEAAPGYGDAMSPVVIVGQSLCRQCMATQVPFTGGSGQLLDRAFLKAEITKEQVFVTNLVHCHPPDNRPSRPEEIDNCSSYLRRELAIMRPYLAVGLGKDACTWLRQWASESLPEWPNIPYELGPSCERPVLMLLAHPSYMRRRPSLERLAYIEELTRALRWAFATAAGSSHAAN